MPTFKVKNRYKQQQQQQQQQQALIYFDNLVFILTLGSI